MSTLSRCEKGHFYDSDKYRTCPFCNQTSVDNTTPINPPKPDDFSGSMLDSEHTVGLWDIENTNTIVKPVVGWLVSIEGTTCGKDFRLCAGRNYVGRSQDMDIVLDDDNAVSRSKHAIIIFDPVSQTALCQAGESRELFYLNGKVVTDTVEMKKGDILTIGRTKLIFVPFSGDVFTWDAAEE